jgi:hypothetical protein
MVKRGAPDSTACYVLYGQISAVKTNATCVGREKEFVLLNSIFKIRTVLLAMSWWEKS